MVVKSDVANIRNHPQMPLQTGSIKSLQSKPEPACYAPTPYTRFLRHTRKILRAHIGSMHTFSSR